MASTPRRRIGALVPQRLRALWTWCREHRHRLVDWSLAALVFPPTAMFQFSGLPSLVPEFTVIPDEASDLPWWLGMLPGLAGVLGTAALVSLAVLWRRSRPVPLLSLALLLMVLFGNFTAAVFAVYSYAAWFPDRVRLLVWTGAFTVTLGTQYRIVAAQSSEPTTMGTSLLAMAMVFGVPLGFGLWTGTRRQLIASLRERTARLEREQQLMVQRAAAEERGHIAREMHDVVAHRVSLMVLHAGGLEVSSTDPRTAEVADTIRGVGREALTELREILGVLRDNSEEAPTAPQPTLADLDRLLGTWREAGMPISRVETGDLPRQLPEAIQRTVYRVLQEGLTNAAKHAPGAEVTVHLDGAPHALTLIVANPPPPPRGDHPPPPSSGHGLAGLGERVTLSGGELDSGATPDGGWQLKAVVPVPESEPAVSQV